MSAKAAEVDLASHVQVIHVGNWEADIFELFAQPRSANSELLVRAVHNRKVKHELNYLIPTIEQAPVVSTRAVELTEIRIERRVMPGCNYAPCS